MFSSLEMSNLVSNKRCSKWTGAKILSGRFLANLLRRLPILILWTLIVIFILYKSIGNNKDEPLKLIEGTKREFQARISHHQYDNFQDDNQKNQLLIRRSSLNDRNSQPTIQIDELNLKIDNHLDESNVITAPLNAKDDNLITKFDKSSDDFVRASKVFILIIQNEDHPQKFHPSPKSNNHNRNFHGFHIPTHINHLIEILDSHRIGYSIDTTRSGLPNLLLDDQDVNKQYSVIVIDDFIKYTRLNRWIRDQLDRHCRSNRVGVITFLMANELDKNQLPELQNTSKGKTYKRHHHQSIRNALTTEDTFSNQFPLIFKKFNRNLTCKNLCSIEYQMNEKSSIFRILKRKKNFVLNEQIKSNDTSKFPWVFMSSNHPTYEPITWAKLQHGTSILQETSSLSPKLEAFKDSGIDTLDLDNSSKHRNSIRTRRRLSSESLYSYSITNRDHNLQQQQRVSKSQKNQQKFEPPTLEIGNDYNVNNSSEYHETSQSSSTYEMAFSGNQMEQEVLSMFDRGLYDGIKRVIFGSGGLNLDLSSNQHWINRILLLDSIEHLSSGRIFSPLDRYIQIDIDDIFVGEIGKRLKKDDVISLIQTQLKFSQLIQDGFKFNLGYSGKYFRHGNEAEILGDEYLIKNAHEFQWFCHMWAHTKAHLFNDTKSIENELWKNLEFAKQHKIPIIGYGKHLDQTEASNANNERQLNRPLPPTYAVAPHHSGVYPIHEQLYEAWRNILNVQVTSTEEYPSLRPASGRRAFVHKAIKVLPRQTCGLYTHTIYRNEYPGGFGQLEASIQGGELFQTILHNPVNIYMTHMSNYANDRLAPYTFNTLFNFVQNYTNLRLRFAQTKDTNSLGPSKLADYYFDLYSNERQPLWTNPCNDKRHLLIWAPIKHRFCLTVPTLLIVGPQKTGSTALYTFLKLNTNFKSSIKSDVDFEEVQFFNDKHYFKGVDWYFERFWPEGAQSSEPIISSNKSERYIYFDKSATYFDDPKAPRRAGQLVPEAKIIILLVNPIDRAYSWYQHVRAHEDPVANSMSFDQIIMSSELQLNAQARSLRNRCLQPGYYAKHLMSWLDYFPSRQMIIIDGDWFKYNPGAVLNRLQLLLKSTNVIDFNERLAFDKQKGFHCALESDDDQQQQQQQEKKIIIDKSTQIKYNKIRCLGKSKGRKYGPMSETVRNYLHHHYLPHNRQLARILADIGQALPGWLERETTNSKIQPF